VITLRAIRQLYDYNYWARDRQLEACRELTPEQFGKSFGGGWSCVRDALAHLADTEAYYLHRWHGRSREEIVSTMGYSRSQERARYWPTRFPTLAPIEQYWQSVEAEVRAYLDGLREADLSQTVTYADSEGRRWSYPLWQLILHVVNHQTYHRGQVSALLRQLGVPPSATDLLDFYSTTMKTETADLCLGPSLN